MSVVVSGWEGSSQITTRAAHKRGGLKIEQQGMINKLYFICALHFAERAIR